MDILAELTQFKNDYTAANELLELATGELNQIKATLADKETALEASHAELSELKAILAEQTAAKEQEKAEIESLKALIAELKTAEKTAEEKAIELVASQGIAPVKVEVEAAAHQMTKAEAREAYAAIIDPSEACNFYVKHRDILLG